jgi:hypothetical protein
MTGEPDKYWDDLGIAWRAMDVDVDVVMPRLRSRLQRQSLLIRSGLLLGVPLASCAIVLGALTIWWGWTSSTWNFVTRGIAIDVVAALALQVLLSLVSVRDSADARALTDMLDLAIRRARRTLVAIHVALSACAIAAVLGLIGAVIRTRSGTPPALSPVIDVAVLVLVAAILLAYRSRIVDRLGRLRYLTKVITPGSSHETKR